MEKNLKSFGDLKKIIATRVSKFISFLSHLFQVKMSSYNPGTMFRIYAADNSKHYTAVLLKDGQVLEVKNPDTGKKETFPSLTMWRASHSATEEDVKVDASKSSGIVIGSDTGGINYPTEKARTYKWVQWCYSIVKEAAPQLLKSEEFKSAYNNMVELCTKHKQELTDWRSYSSGTSRYSPNNIHIATKNQYRGEMSGFPGSFQYQYYSYSPYSGPGHKRYSKEEYDKASSEIGAAYVAIVNIIKPEIESYMTKKYNIATTEKDISNKRAAIKRYQKKLITLQNEINWYTSYIKLDTDAITKLQEELITKKMEAV